MTIKQALKDKQKEFMKERAKANVDTVRLLLTEMQYEEIKTGVNDLSDTDTVAILKREVKKRQEELEFAKQGNRPELLPKLQSEISLIEAFLPKQMSREELAGLVKKIVADSPGANMGVIMKTLKESHTGQYDGKMASEVVKEILG